MEHRSLIREMAFTLVQGTAMTLTVTGLMNINEPNVNYKVQKIFVV